MSTSFLHAETTDTAVDIPSGLSHDIYFYQAWCLTLSSILCIEPIEIYLKGL